MDIFVLVTILFSLYLLLEKKKVNTSAMIATCILFVFLLVFVVFNKNDSFGLIWTLCFPLFVIPILGTRKGIFMILLFYAALTPLVYLGIGEWNHGLWDFTSFLRFFIASIAIIFAAYFFEATSVSAYQTIINIRENEQLYLQELKNLSLTDQLTELHNRRYFDEQYQLEYKKIQRNHNKLCLIMIDIDNFKTVNDKFGHQIGDQVLTEFSKLLKSRIRTTDTLSRWGGEEFIIMLPETSISNASIIAEKMRVVISEQEFTKIGKLTASFGVAEVKLEQESNEQAIINADSALYQAKRNGRNRVVVFET